MKQTSKWIAGCCALALLVSLAACKGTPAAEPSDTGSAAAYASDNTNAGQPLDESESLTADETGEPASSAEASGRPEASTAEPDPETPTKPIAPGKALNKAEVLALYQAGVNQTKDLKRVKYSRQLTYGKLWSPGNFDGAAFDLMEDEKAKPIFSATDTATENAAPVALKDSIVESAACNDAGGKRVLTIKLKPSAGGNSIASGAGGYLEPVDFELVKSMAKAYGKAMFPLANISTKSIQSTLSGGTYQVTISADGRIERAALSYRQTVKGDMKLSFPSYEIQCDVRFQMSVEYAV